MPFDPETVTFDEIAADENDDAEDLDEANDNEQEQPSSDENQEDDGELSDIEAPSDEDLEDAFSGDDDDDTTDELEDDEDDNLEEEPTDEEGEGEEDTEELNFVEEFGSQLGLDEEELQDHDDTWDDALEVARKGAENLATQEVNNFFEKYPDVAEYTKFRVNGGDPEEYRDKVLNAPSYDDLELEGNESTQERIVREKLNEVDGFSDEKVDDKIERYKSGGMLKSEAEDAKDILSNRQEKKREQLVKEQEKRAEQRRQEQIEEQKRYKQTIHESDNFSGLQVPENQKDSFEKYLFEPVDESGMTQAEKDYQNMSREESLALYYLTFQGLDNLGELVDNKASTKRAQKLSEKLKKTGSRSVSDKSDASKKRSNDGDLSGFNLDEELLG